ncbi:unnamed protein product [Protopolystoma xenopodis]|uniref:Uncharacterized protein n=1 Tax=Protopolystoma xenopodis TaxID=117903 RepID=A0A3S5CEP6_9PLAT|nr:unnamed protein product [Protopolystoma xenopodis]
MLLRSRGTAVGLSVCPTCKPDERVCMASKSVDISAAHRSSRWSFVFFVLPCWYTTAKVKRKLFHVVNAGKAVSLNFILPTIGHFSGKGKWAKSKVASPGCRGTEWSRRLWAKNVLNEHS